tara:strand:+ start:5435 stop:6100 length:666 start_codon:yes stop_codon:yes gene_type:complete
MRITVFHMPKSKKGPFHLVYAVGAWRESSVKNRGWAKAPIVYQREATEAEVLQQANENRNICYRYRTWADLAEDEARYGVDAASLVRPSLRDHYGVTSAAQEGSDGQEETEDLEPQTALAAAEGAWTRSAYLRVVREDERARGETGYVATFRPDLIKHDLRGNTFCLGDIGSWYVIEGGTDPLSPDYKGDKAKANRAGAAYLALWGVPVYRTNLPALVPIG